MKSAQTVIAALKGHQSRIAGWAPNGKSVVQTWSSCGTNLPKKVSPGKSVAFPWQRRASDRKRFIPLLLLLLYCMRHHSRPDHAVEPWARKQPLLTVIAGLNGNSGPQEIPTIPENISLPFPSPKVQDEFLSTKES